MTDVVAPSRPARPFLKWAGGKSQLLAEYDALFVETGPLATYHEPFVGGGAVFFHLRGRGALGGRVVLSDLNPHLVSAWTAVRDGPAEVAASVAALAAKHSSDEYYRERARFNGQDMGLVERAALLLYLNKAGFNGLYRVNRRGHFNVPVGKSASGPSFPDAAHLEACARALAGVEILAAPFASVLDRARAGDFVYFDPPYVPVSPTAFFTDYAWEGFGRPEHELLRDVFVQLDRRGCHVMLSNSGNFEVVELFKGYRITHVQARRSINSKGTARGPVNEVVITNG